MNADIYGYQDLDAHLALAAAGSLRLDGGIGGPSRTSMDCSWYTAAQATHHLQPLNNL
jgi:hypothetical protein